MGLHYSRHGSRPGTPASPSSRRRNRSRSGSGSPTPFRDAIPATFLEPQNVYDAPCALSWNLSAVNNNPFEYWLSYDSDDYYTLMMGVEYFLTDPGESDVEVSAVFTDDMFKDLKGMLAAEHMEGLDDVENMWRGGALDLMHRKFVSEFVQDQSLGAKRLISMPDRVTNTINVVTMRATQYQPPPMCRPSVMNNYEGDLSSVAVWWKSWKKFMFVEEMTVRTQSDIAVLRPIQMLEPIRRSKYPAITEAEELISVPLQVVCLAVFDALIVHLMNELSPDSTWQSVKSEICHKLYRNKHAQQVGILEDIYSKVDVMCLQEVASVFADAWKRSALATTHEYVVPELLDAKRDQNSVIAISKSSFVTGSISEVTSAITSCFPDNVKLANGDLLAIDVINAKDQSHCIIVSFHGDTNGVLTAPLLTAIDCAVKMSFPNHRLIIGMDANVYEQKEEGKANFDDCIHHILELGMTTCWGDSPNAKACRTTCAARTFLQPQLNKAVRYRDQLTKSNMDPKDLIVFYKAQYLVASESDMGDGRQPNPLKDNTGKLRYKESTVFPSLEFPSDHGILAVALRKAEF